MRLSIIIIMTMLGLLLPVAAADEPPGEIFEVNGHRLHMNCTGVGGTTVVLESGVGGFSLNWTTVQPGIAEFTRVCSYDRRGYGWSDPSEGFDIETAVADLEALLLAAGEPGPYIFVAHSFGGVTTRAFQAANPDQVVGVIFLDAVHPQLPNRIAAYPSALRLQLRQLNIVADTLRVLLTNEAEGTEAFTAFLPDENSELYLDKALEDKSVRVTIDEANYMLDEMPSFDLPDTLGDIPFVVVTHGIPERNSFLGAVVGVEEAAEAETTWQALQQELVALSPRGRLIIAEDSQHSIQFDQPDLVIGILQLMLAEIR